MACTSANRASTTRCRSRFSPLPDGSKLTHVAKSPVEGFHEGNAAQKIVPVFEQDLAGIGVDQAAHEQQQQKSGDQSQARPIMFRARRSPTRSVRGAATLRRYAPATKSHTPSMPAAARSPNRSWSALISCAWEYHRMIGPNPPTGRRLMTIHPGLSISPAHAAGRAAHPVADQ